MTPLKSQVSTGASNDAISPSDARVFSGLKYCYDQDWMNTDNDEISEEKYEQLVNSRP